MRRLVSFLVLLAIILFAVALWRGWITIFVNKPKVQQDKQSMKNTLDNDTQKAKEVIHKEAKELEKKTGN